MWRGALLPAALLRPGGGEPGFVIFTSSQGGVRLPIVFIYGSEAFAWLQAARASM